MCVDSMRNLRSREEWNSGHTVGVKKERKPTMMRKLAETSQICHKNVLTN